MQQLDEAALSAYLDKWVAARFSRLVLNRCFQGIVRVVDLVTTPFTVQVQRTGETAIDPTPYACPVPGYTPLVGDRVELIWRDDASAEVLAPLGAQNHYRARAYVSGTLPTFNGTAVMPYDVVDDDPHRDFITGAAAKYTCPVPGSFIVCARFNNGTASVRTYISVLVNAVEVRRGDDLTLPGVAGVSVATIVRCNAGDYIQGQGTTGSSSSLAGGSPFNYIEIAYLGP